MLSPKLIPSNPCKTHKFLLINIAQRELGEDERGPGNGVFNARAHLSLKRAMKTRGKKEFRVHSQRVFTHVRYGILRTENCHSRHQIRK